MLQMRRIPFVVLTLLLLALLTLLLWLVLTLTRPAVGSTLKFTPDQLPEAQVGQSYNATITISDNVTPVGQMSIADGALPRGLALYHTRGSSTAAIKGIPTESGNFKLLVSAWCFGTNVGGQTGQQSYELVVK